MEDNILKYYQDREVIYLLPRYHSFNDSMVDTEPEYEPLDAETLQDIDAQHFELVHNYELEKQYQEWIEVNMVVTRNRIPDEDRRRNREAYRDSALFEHNTWNQFKVIENNQQSGMFVPGAVRGI